MRKVEPRQTYGRRTGRRPTPTRRSADQAPARDGRLHYTGHTTVLSQPPATPWPAN
ncbi:hypothetical protein ACIRU5_19220 [Streptomyces misionensis]|uniref:hypothetical protein n=1 Tax=Streptomyces misionensis TaxID=67331 RepID=UPI00382C67A0